MKLIFGLEFDEMPIPFTEESGVWCCGKNNLLSLLEKLMGLHTPANNVEYLRVEQYRQAILGLLEQNTNEDPDYFFIKSFEADKFATASELLSRRDELKLAAWDFEIRENTPLRLKTIAQIEKSIYQKQIQLYPGFTERFVAVMKMLDMRDSPFSEIWLNEPISLHPPHFERLFQKLLTSAELHYLEANEAVNSSTLTDLQILKNRFLIKPSSSNRGKNISKGDGSLVLFRVKRNADAAAWLAKLFKLNPELRPTCVLTDKNRTLDTALINEGLPSLGMPSASLARPTLQILKLATTFLWQPVDPFKILEFVSLPIKPLPDELSLRIAHFIAQTPGTKGERWYGMVNGFFQEMEEHPNLSQAEKSTARKQYNFWFERQRYDMDKTVPLNQAGEIFQFLRNWARQKFDEMDGRNHSLLVLSEQAKRITELLEALPENEISHLELERIVRAIYEPSPVLFREREASHLPYVFHPANIAKPCQEVLWWNFVQKEPVHFFSRWYQNERDYLVNSGKILSGPERENALQQWQSSRPILWTQNQLMLVIPDSVHGEMTNAHPLLADIQALFEDIDQLTINIDKSTGQALLSGQLCLPPKISLPLQPLGKPQAFYTMRPSNTLARENETYTSLESLFYFPYQWVFKYRLKLHKSSILSVVNDNALMGNLSHRLFEKLLSEQIQSFTQESLNEWINLEARKIFNAEGNVLLMYGREPDRVAFINTMKFAAWSLISHIRENGWKVRQTEAQLEGQFPFYSDAPLVTPLKGIADLILQRGDELAIVDIKWRGAAYREQSLRNEEDLQLALYAKLLSNLGPLPHTAFFIVNKGKMIARNNHAFKKVIPVLPDADHEDTYKRILSRMEATWLWRLEQLSKGIVEVRTPHTAKEIEDTYATDDSGKMMQVLEMAGEKPFYDDYQALINMLE